VGGLGITSSSSRVAREGKGRGARTMAHDEGLVVMEGVFFVSGGVGGGEEREVLLAREGEVVT
jgi:hypothetical protein